MELRYLLGFPGRFLFFLTGAGTWRLEEEDGMDEVGGRTGSICCCFKWLRLSSSLIPKKGEEDEAAAIFAYWLIRIPLLMMKLENIIEQSKSKQGKKNSFMVPNIVRIMIAHRLIIFGRVFSL